VCLSSAASLLVEDCFVAGCIYICQYFYIHHCKEKKDNKENEDTRHVSFPLLCENRCVETECDGGGGLRMNNIPPVTPSVVSVV
jgi:hypothetical protein